MPFSVRHYLILIALGVATIIAFLLINFLSGGGGSSSSKAPSVDVLTQEILELESSILEYEVIDIDTRQELGNYKSLLEEKYDQINFMEQKIDELERQGKADASTIKSLRGRVAEARNLLVNQYKVEINELVKDNSNLTQIMDSMLFESMQIETVYQSKMDSLIALLNNCGQRSETSETPLPPKAEDSVPILSALNFSFKYQASEGSSPTPFEKSVKQRNLNTLYITFDLKGNKLVPTEQKQVYLVIEDPDGKAYSNPRLNYGGTISLNGRESVYSRKAKVEYQNGLVSSVSVEFALNDFKEFQKGRHTVKVFYEGEELGRTLFLII